MAGQTSSGGGGIIKISPHRSPILLDLYVAKPDLREPMSRRDQLPASPTKFAQVAGYDNINIKSLHAYHVAKKRLAVWQKHSPTLVRILQGALDHLELRQTWYR